MWGWGWVWKCASVLGTLKPKLWLTAPREVWCVSEWCGEPRVWESSAMLPLLPSLVEKHL